jgi:membrane fusion protein, copper/silver efflux system
MADMAAGAMPERVPVEVTPSMLQALGVRIEEVGRESLTQDHPAVATVVPDESRISHVHTRVAGWVEQLDVNTTGEMVRAGQPLARIFSQELLSSQTEYLAARRARPRRASRAPSSPAGGHASPCSACRRRRSTPSSRRANRKRLVTVVAPRQRRGREPRDQVGTAVDPSTTLLTIADLSRVWVLAEVPGGGDSNIASAATAQLDFPASGRPFAARVDFLYPTLTERTRTLRVRFSVGQSRGTLRPGLYGTRSSNDRTDAYRAARRRRRHRTPAARVRRHGRSVRAAPGDARRAAG